MEYSRCADNLRRNLWSEISVRIFVICANWQPEDEGILICSVFGAHLTIHFPDRNFKKFSKYWVIKGYLNNLSSDRPPTGYDELCLMPHFPHEVLNHAAIVSAVKRSNIRNREDG